MNKQEFLLELKKGLFGLPQDDIEERLTFYSEMVDDRMEEGLSEKDAVDGLGAADTIVSQIVADIPLAKLVKKRITPQKRLNVREIILLVLGSPIWLSLAVAVSAVILALNVSLWSVIISFWAVFISLIGSALGSLLTEKVFITQTDTGIVDVPKTITGGKCEITTNTGDIIIKID